MDQCLPCSHAYRGPLSLPGSDMIATSCQMESSCHKEGPCSNGNPADHAANTGRNSVRSPPEKRQNCKVDRTIQNEISTVISPNLRQFSTLG